MEHDFFQCQPCVADAYLLRYIFHNWSDKDCTRILKALRPALRNGTKLLVMELLQDHRMVSPETWFEDRIVRFVTCPVHQILVSIDIYHLIEGVICK